MSFFNILRYFVLYTETNDNLKFVFGIFYNVASIKHEQFRPISSFKKYKNLTAIKIAQNKILRVLNISTIKVRRKTWNMSYKFYLLSFNQLAASIKLTESWKCINENKYPIKPIMIKKIMVTI